MCIKVRAQATGLPASGWMRMLPPDLLVAFPLESRKVQRMPNIGVSRVLDLDQVRDIIARLRFDVPDAHDNILMLIKDRVRSTWSDVTAVRISPYWNEFTETQDAVFITELEVEQPGRTQGVDRWAGTFEAAEFDEDLESLFHDLELFMWGSDSPSRLSYIVPLDTDAEMNFDSDEEYAAYRTIQVLLSLNYSDARIAREMAMTPYAVAKCKEIPGLAELFAARALGEFR